MRANIFLILFLLVSAIIITLTNEQLRVYIFAQQQQGLLQFTSPTESPLSEDDALFNASAEDLTQQVDWVYDNLGRCWNAWSSNTCGLQQHEGGVTIPAMRDLNHDGIEDITCTQGGTSNGTTITNTSDRTITINCERYTCNACTSGNGTHAQCDGSIDPNAKRVVETVELTPGCIATCTMQGVYGTCLEQKNPPTAPSISPTPTIHTALPTATPAPLNSLTPSPSITSVPPTRIPPTEQPSTVPTTSPPPTNPPQATQSPAPSTIPAGAHLPVMIDYSSYQESFNQHPPTYVYAMMNRDYNAMNTTRGINGLAGINGNVIKIIMISKYDALEQILTNHAEEIKAADITWIGYNAEKDGRTPQTELDAIYSTNAAGNIINKMGKLTDRYGLKLMLGPTTPMWEQLFRNSDSTAVIKAMVGDKCYLDGIAFQEQKQISLTNKETRAQIVGERTAIFRNNAPNCPHFEASVQLMSSWCEQNASWDECRAYYNLLRELEGQSRINSLAIWASGAERNDLPGFIQHLRN